MVALTLLHTQHQDGIGSPALLCGSRWRLPWLCGMCVQMITHTGVIATVLIVDAFALLMYNVSGMCVTGHLGAVFRQGVRRTWQRNLQRWFA